MELVKLTETIVKELVKDSDSVTVKEFPSENEGEITIQVMVPEDEMGRVIGKQGRVAKAIRTLMRSLGAKEKKRITIEFID